MLANFWPRVVGIFFAEISELNRPCALRATGKFLRESLAAGQVREPDQLNKVAKSFLPGRSTLAPCIRRIRPSYQYSAETKSVLSAVHGPPWRAPFPAVLVARPLLWL